MREMVMSHVEAIFRHGVFEPLEPVNLPEEQRVQLSFEAKGKLEFLGWLKKVRALQEEIIREVGILPDSTTDIAEDRLR